MPSDKRQRQDEGRLSRMEAQRQAQQRSHRRRQARSLLLLLVALVAVAFAISVFSDDDDEAEVATDEGTTTTAADGATTSTSTPESTPAGDPAIGDTACPPAEGAVDRTTTFESGPQACIDPARTYTATVETSAGTFTAELDARQAPKAVNNFVFLARNRFYEGVTFHRIIPGFVVQGGDANGDPAGSGDPGYEFADELPTAGPPFYEVGSLAMANSGPDTNGSQFFVVTGEQGVDLEAKYSLFGKVTEGMDVVAAIEATGTESGTPSEATTITKVTVTEV